MSAENPYANQPDPTLGLSPEDAQYMQNLSDTMEATQVANEAERQVNSEPNHAVAEAQDIIDTAAVPERALANTVNLIGSEAVNAVLNESLQDSERQATQNFQAAREEQRRNTDTVMSPAVARQQADNKQAFARQMAGAQPDLSEFTKH